MAETGTIIKRGETVIQFTLHRNQSHSKDGVGLFMSVKTVPAVEDFMRQLSVGLEPVEVKAAGRYWIALDKDHPLTCYRLSEKIPIEQADDNGADNPFGFDYIGSPLLIPSDHYRKPILNLSFLRLVGISEGAGVSFGIKGVQSLDSLHQIQEDMSTACRKFYVRYLKPIDLTVMVSTQEIGT